MYEMVSLRLTKNIIKLEFNSPFTMFQVLRRNANSFFLCRSASLQKRVPKDWVNILNYNEAMQQHLRVLVQPWRKLMSW